MEFKTMNYLLELAERCEKAEKGDRELDAEIALTLGVVTERDGNVFFGHKDYSCMVLERDYYDIEGSAPELPAYTRSLDAAMTLVPDGWLIETITQISFDGLEGVSLVNTCPLGRVQSFGTSTLHLALCAAALRACVLSKYKELHP